MERQGLTAILERLRNLPNSNELLLMTKGIERESLRIDANGAISKSDHPTSLGHPLTHPYITTDFAEQLVELVTPTFKCTKKLLSFLTDLHAFAAQNMDGDRFWPYSMPCAVENDDDITIAKFGDSNIGKMKSLYREGLANRYGKRMQTISGIHYNVSFNDDLWKHVGVSKDEAHMNLVRNVIYNGWIIPYFFGASINATDDFIAEAKSARPYLNEMIDGLDYSKTTSLRVSELGYQNKSRDELLISYNSLTDYIHTLTNAIHQEDRDWKEIGLKDEDGNYKQLSDKKLQITNELYSVVRPKQVVSSEEDPLEALATRGIEYVELRALDINPDSPVGITEEQINFIDTFMLYCALEKAPSINELEEQTYRINWSKVATQGRDRELKLTTRAGEILLTDWIDVLSIRVSAVAELLDKAHDTNKYSNAVTSVFYKRDPFKGHDYHERRAVTEGHHQTLLNRKIDEGFLTQMASLTVKSATNALVNGQLSKQSFSEYLDSKSQKPDRTASKQALSENFLH